MATNLQFTITLKPVGYADKWPEFYLKIDNDVQDMGILEDERTYNFDVELEDGPHTINVGFTNKVDTDTVANDNKIVADKAVIVEHITIEGYEFKDFLYRGVYTPVDRPESHSNYLSWNGEWQLEFTTPIFTWLHKTQHVGWIYEKNI
jgi:hypothetical protein